MNDECVSKISPTSLCPTKAQLHLTPHNEWNHIFPRHTQHYIQTVHGTFAM